MPDESKQFNAKIPPFQNFLVEKVLAKMKEKDAEFVRTNQLEANKAFTYEIIKEEDLIREIVIHNIDDERLKELKSSIRWTLEKMYEKMQS
jgi:DNA polymerase sigma